MAARSIASLTLGFGLVAIPVKLYTATEPTAAIRFKLMGREGARLRQQYVVDASAAPAWEETDVSAPAPAASPARAAPAVSSQASGAEMPPHESAAPRAAGPASAEGSVVQPLWTGRGRSGAAPTAAAPEPTVVERSEMLRGYEFERGRYVLFTPAELKALEAGTRRSIDIVAFIPGGSVDPVYYDKAYYLAPEPRAVRTYSLLLETLRRTGRSALAKWAWRGKEYVVEVRAADGGLVLQQLLYAEEVRPLQALHVPMVPVSAAELALATQLVDTITEKGYDPGRFVDEERRRVLEAVEAKVAGRRVVAHAVPRAGEGAEVIDLMEALRASLRQQAPQARMASSGRREPPVQAPSRKPARRAPAAPPAAAEPGVPAAATASPRRAAAKSRARK